ncbi:MAG TPA: hypothetical protein VEV45_26110 [Streptosporangiaceae bacterium]|nr:hypothetical protein [Streptosporangiaceae bacterium]
MTDSGSIRWRLRSALLGAGPTCPAQAPAACGRPGCVRGGGPPAAAPAERGIATSLDGFGRGLVILENEDEIFDATPRAPLAAVATAAAAASWIEAPSPGLGGGAIRDGIGCVPDGDAEAAMGEGDQAGDGVRAGEAAVGEGDRPGAGGGDFDGAVGAADD